MPKNKYFYVLSYNPVTGKFILEDNSDFIGGDGYDFEKEEWFSVEFFEHINTKEYTEFHEGLDKIEDILYN